MIHKFTFPTEAILEANGDSPDSTVREILVRHEKRENREGEMRPTSPT